MDEGGRLLERADLEIRARELPEPVGAIDLALVRRRHGVRALERRDRRISVTVGRLPDGDRLQYVVTGVVSGEVDGDHLGRVDVADTHRGLRQIGEPPPAELEVRHG
jgi:hypothetical protein